MVDPGWLRAIPKSVVRLRASELRLRRALCWPLQRRQILERLEVVRPGPALESDPERLVVVSLVRDGEEHVETFVEHHRRLGAAGIVLLDNGSSDATVERAARMEAVTVLRCRLPYKSHSYAYKRFLVECYGAGRWCLLADIDERFDYPASDRLPLRAFLRYLNARGYTAVAAQMLDLFPEGPPAGWPTDGRELVAAAVWYDLSAVKERELGRTGRINRFADPGMKLLEGGIRRQVFGATALLTKFALLYRDRGRGPVLESAHLCRGAYVADVNGLLLHYKFDGHFAERCRQAVRERNYFSGSAAYRLYLQALEVSPDLVLRRATARPYRGTGPLVEEGFLRVSQDYRAYISAFERSAAAKRGVEDGG